MTGKKVGTWSKTKGSIMVYLPGFRTVAGRKKPYKTKYIGDPDDPFPPAAVERDLSVEFKISIKLKPTSPRGGDIILVG